MIMENTYVMHSMQLVPGDVVTESGIRSVTLPGEVVRDTRGVTLSEVRSGWIMYKGRPFQVWYVTGTDNRNGKSVRWTASAWRRWISERPSIAVLRNAVTA
jgi:hypothetical protein